MATRTAQIDSIVKLATKTAERDLQAGSSESTSDMLALISTVTDQIKQRAGSNQGLNDLIAMIESALPAVKLAMAKDVQIDRST